MNINRHNYEEYFILYVDNELGSEDRRRVEEFAAVHPDLREELDILLQSKLVPDNHIMFDGKEDLLQFSTPSLAITMVNYEEWLVLYMDNELNAEERTAVERFAGNNPSVKEELSLLLKTKLQPETVLFPNKESLYRREEKVRRIPAWWRMAAAAAIILAVGTTALVLLNNDKPGTVAGPTAGTNPSAEKTATETPAVADNNTKEINPSAAQEKAEQPIIDPGKINNAAILATQDNRNPAIKEKKQTSLPLQDKKEEPLIATTVNNGNNLPQPDQNPNVNPALKTNDAIAKADVLPKKELTVSPETKYIAPVTKDIAQPSFVSNPVVDNPDMEQPDGKKNKLRGFFRKVTRTFEKRTNIDATDGEDRLLVAGLSIKLK